MYSYLGQKIFIGKEKSITTLKYNETNDLMALGFDDGSMKIVGFEDSSTQQENMLKLTLNHNLNKAHQSPIKEMSWNEKYEKLLSLDERGLMVVWVKDPSLWYTEEMINQSESDRIIKAGWSTNGSLVVIVQESGGIIMGSVQGEKLWKTSIDFKVIHLDWIENDESLVMADSQGNLIALETSSGEVFAEFQIKEKEETIESCVVFCDGNGLKDDYSQFLVGFEDGQLFKIQSLRVGTIERVEIQCDQLINCTWNKKGDLFCISCTQDSSNLVQIFDYHGNLMSYILTPALITQMDFWQFGTKIMLACDHYIYFNRLKMDYQQQYLRDKNKIVCLSKSLKNHDQLFFYNLSSLNCKILKFSEIKMIRSNELDQVVLVEQIDNQFIAQLLNDRGELVDSVQLMDQPQNCVFQDQIIVFEFKDFLTIWKLQNIQLDKVTPKQVLFMDLKNPTKILDITLNPKVEDTNLNQQQKVQSMQIIQNQLFVANGNNLIRIFNLVNFQEQKQIILKRTVIAIYFSPQLDHLAILTRSNTLIIFKVHSNNRTLDIVREEKDVWEFQWGFNDLEYFYMKKNKLYQSSLENKENSGGHFKTDLFFIGMNFEYLILFDIESLIIEKKPIYKKVYKRKLEDLKELIRTSKVSFDDVINDDNNIQFLQFIADQFLINKRYREAEKGYRKIERYTHLYFLNEIKDSKQNEDYKQALIYLFLNLKDKAIKFLQQKNKEDLLICILEEMKSHKNMLMYQDSLQNEKIQLINYQLGLKMMHQGHYNEAIEYFEVSQASKELIQIYAKIGQFQKLTNLAQEIEEKETIEVCARLLINNNIIRQGCLLLEKVNKAKEAVDVAIFHNEWDVAVEIAQRNNFVQIDNLLNKFARIFQEKNQKIQLMQLYRKAGRNLQVAHILKEVAEDLIVHKYPPLLIKKLFVLSGLEVTLEKKKISNPNITSNLTNLSFTDQSRIHTNNTLNTLITSDLSNISDKTFKNPWKGAEAWHFFLLTLLNFKKEQLLRALIMASKLDNYLLELSPNRVYIIQCLIYYQTEQFEKLSKILSKLKKLIKDEELVEKLEEFTFEIFRETEPQDKKIKELIAFNCKAKGCRNQLNDLDSYCNQCGSYYSSCIVSGKTLFLKNYIKCSICKHKMLKEELTAKQLKNCPLCHQKIKYPIDQLLNTDSH